MNTKDAILFLNDIEELKKELDSKKYKLILNRQTKVYGLLFKGTIISIITTLITTYFLYNVKLNLTLAILLGIVYSLINKNIYNKTENKIEKEQLELEIKELSKRIVTKEKELKIAQNNDIESQENKPITIDIGMYNKILNDAMAYHNDIDFTSDETNNLKNNISFTLDLNKRKPRNY